jgi:hypothetical protein
VSEDRVIIVHLRRPARNDPEEMRSDPYWELGSFGITGCHRKNLMNPRNASKLDGVRLAFAQGGDQGTRLVHLTPRVKIVGNRSGIEAQWAPAEMPFRYESAPLLALAAGDSAKSQFPRLAASLRTVKRSTPPGQFASKYRSAATYLDERLAKEVIQIYDGKRSRAPRSEFASSYVDALPWPPPLIDVEREQTYTKCRDEACGSKREMRVKRRKPC